MSKVTVLMSTYNGEKYLKEQMDSILDQDFSGDIKLLIRDDGSQDATKKIISAYKCDKNRSIELIDGENIGPQKSFLELIHASEESDYYFFSDQDDIWYTDKISRAVSFLETKSKPACYCSNYDIEYINILKKRENVLSHAPSDKPLRIIFYNQIPGCVIGFNKMLMGELKKIHLDNVMMHDSMVLSFASSIGDVIYDARPTIAHRIHGNNVVGEGHRKIVFHKWIREKLHLVMEKEDYDLSEMADQFIKSGKVKEEYISDLTLLRDYKKNWTKTILLLCHPDSHGIFLDRTTLSIRFKIFFHVF